MTTISKVKLRDRRGAVTAMGIGLLLTVIALIALIIDQVRGQTLARHVQTLYAPHDLNPDPNVLFGYLYVVGVIGILLWLATIWGIIQHKRGARVVATTVFVLGSSVALFNIFVSEYGMQIFPTLWGVLGLLPSVAGLLAVIILWRQGRSMEWS